MPTKTAINNLTHATPKIIETLARFGFNGPSEVAIALAQELCSIAPQAQTAPPLRAIHTAQNGKVSDKWDSYFDVYDRELAYLRDSSISLLEIGVQNGGSLEVWTKYFKRANIIIGCDINPLCAQLAYEDPRVKVIAGDANQADTREKITQHTDKFDVIIDDGSHLSNDIIESFKNYFPLIKPGGVYIVEDLHAVYRPVPGGGVLSRISAMEFFKVCAELPNTEHWQQSISPAIMFSTFFPTVPPSFCTDQSIESVCFYTSMVVIRKSKSKAELGQRMVTGEDARVFPGVLRHKKQHNITPPLNQKSHSNTQQ